MATPAAAQLLAKGPLSSAIGQWMFVGFGTFVIFTGDNGVSRAAQEIASVAFRLVAGGKDGVSAASLLREAALGGQVATNAMNNAVASQQQQPQQPIIIHSVSSPSSFSDKNGWTMTVVQLGLASGACWTAYVVFANYLPDSIKEMMPVTRKFFESAVTSLGQGILRVKEALGEQIAQLSRKQDELLAKQEDTHDKVLGLGDDIGDVRLHIDDIAVAISRCESSLEDAAGRQNYMSRGVRLLVHCVGDLLRSSDPAVADELARFSRLGDGLPHEESIKTHLECPGSPNLSEIGSTTSTVDDRHLVRTLSLPRPRRSAAVTPPPQASNSTSKAVVTNGMISPPVLGMLQSFNHGSRRGSGIDGRKTESDVSATSMATATTSGRSATGNLTRSNSSPENEVPVSNSERSRFDGMDMEEKLRFIGLGGV